MKIAIVGAGIAGLASAWMLEQQHEVSVYEANPHFGGHARTVEVNYRDELGADRVGLAETGFRFVIRDSFPHVRALFELLGVEVDEVPRSMTVMRPGRAALVLPPRNVAQLRPLGASPRLIADLLRLRRLVSSGPAFLAANDRTTTVGEFCEREGFSREFVRGMLLPMIAGSWGASRAQMAEFPIFNIFSVFQGSAILQIRGGTSAYISKLAAEIRRAMLYRSRAVTQLRAHEDGGVWVVDAHGDPQRFDAVVLASECGHAATLAAGVDPQRADLLGEFRSFPTTIVIHTDPSVMPPELADWSMVNVMLADDPTREPSLTDCLDSKHGVPVLRTWVTGHDRHPRGVVHEQSFRHQLVTADTPALRERLLAQQGERGLWVVGMYAGAVDNHEGALGSAIALVERLSPGSQRLAKLRIAGAAFAGA